MAGYNNFFVQQLLETRGTQLPSLDYLAYGEPTTYGTSFVYSEEVARSLQHPRVPKGSMNKGSGGMTAAPWAENVVAKEKMASVYGTDFKKSEPPEVRFDAAALIAKNKAMKQKQRAEAVVRQEELFVESQQAHDAFMKSERERYAKAQEKFDLRASRVYNHKGVSLRPRQTDVEQFAETLDKRAAMEARIRETVPRRTALTPQPTLDMLKTVDDSKFIVPVRARSVAGGEGIFEGNLGGFSDPTPHTTTSIASAFVHTNSNGASKRNSTNNAVVPTTTSATKQQQPRVPPAINASGALDISNVSTADRSAGGRRGSSEGGAIQYGAQHVYPADRQRIKFLQLEARRHAEGQSGLAAHGWSGATDPSGPERRPYAPEDDDGGLDGAGLSRVEAAVRKRRQEDAARREAAEAGRADAARQLQEQMREMAALSQQPGVHRRTQRQFADIMSELLKDSTAQITVPKDLGIIPALSDSIIADHAKAVPNGEYKTSLAGAVPMQGGAHRALRGIGGGHHQRNNNKGKHGDDEGDEDAAAAAAGIKTSAPRDFNIISNEDGASPGSSPRGKNGINDNTSTASLEAVASTAEGAGRPLRRTVHTHLPLPISQRTPMNPTRRDIDRELRTVVHGGHLLRDRTAAVKALGPERIAYVKAMDLSGGGGKANNTSGARHGIASVSSGGGGARMAKPMVPPATVGKASLALL